MSAHNVKYLDELSPNVRLVDLGVPRLWTSLPEYRRYLIQNRPNIVISSMPLANGIAAWAKRLGTIDHKLIITEHNAISMAFGDLEIPRYRPLMWAIRPGYRYADAAVGVSDGVVEGLRNKTGVNPDKIHRIYNPAWSVEMEEKGKESIELPPPLGACTHPIIISAGRLELQKDFVTLIRAFSMIRMKRQVKLVILGEGSLRSKLEVLVNELGVSSEVYFAGFQENPFAWFSRSSVFALSSIYEGFGNVLVEAMACGTPVVSTNCPSGPSEILDNGQFGELVSVGDYIALAKGIERTLDSPKSADALKARAREFSIEASVNSYLELIESLDRSSY